MVETSKLKDPVWYLVTFQRKWRFKVFKNLVFMNFQKLINLPKSRPIMKLFPSGFGFMIAIPILRFLIKELLNFHNVFTCILKLIKKIEISSKSVFFNFFHEWDSIVEIYFVQSISDNIYSRLVPITCTQLFSGSSKYYIYSKNMKKN